MRINVAGSRGRSAGAPPPGRPGAPWTRLKVTRTVKQKKVETFREDHPVALASCQDLTGPLLLPELSAGHPIVSVKLGIDIFPLDTASSERLDQLKMHLAAQYQTRDKIVETKVKLQVKGRQTIIAGEKIVLTGYDPRFEDEAQAGFCCFGRPHIKLVKINIIKQFETAPLHFSGGNLVDSVPPPVTSYPAQAPTAPLAPPLAGWQATHQPQAAYPPQAGWFPPQAGGYPPQTGGYPLVRQNTEPI